MANKECKKVKYASSDIALQAIPRIKKKFNENNVRKTYFCHCGSWHLTSQLDGRDIRIQTLEYENTILRSEIESVIKDGYARNMLIGKINKDITMFSKMTDLGNKLAEKDKVIFKLTLDNNKLIQKILLLENKSNANQKTEQ